MPPKKKNGLTMYIELVMRPKLKDTSSQKLPLSELINDAFPLYEALSVTEKNHYSELAKEYNKKLKGTVMPILVTHKPDFSDNDNLFKESEMNSLNKAKQLIFDKIKKKSIEEIMKMKFYYIGAESMCLIDDYTMPLIEVGIIQLSLNEGIMKQLHKLINPGKIPTGYTSAAMENSQIRHLIPIEKFAEGERFYDKIYNSIVNFFEDSDYICFCLAEDTTHVFRGLDWLYEKAKLKNSPSIILGKVEDLLEILLKKVGVQTHMDIPDIFNVSYYDYTDDYICPAHDEVNSKYCALGSTKRNCYITMGHLAKFYNIELTNKHLPKETLVKAGYQQINTINIPCELNAYTSIPSTLNQIPVSNHERKYGQMSPSNIEFHSGNLDLTNLRNKGRGSSINSDNCESLNNRSVISQIAYSNNRTNSYNSLNSLGSGGGNPSSVKSCGPFNITKEPKQADSIIQNNKPILIPPLNFEIPLKPSEPKIMNDPINIQSNLQSSFVKKLNIQNVFDTASMSGLTRCHSNDQNDTARLSDISDSEYEF